MSEETTTVDIVDSEMELLRFNKKDAYNYRERRHDDWDRNYSLYRDKVQTNRLTQRQSVNVPLMKQTIRTLLKDVDDMPVLYFENLDNDKEAEVFKNEYWKWTVEQNRLELQDIVDKRQVFLFGRSFMQLQIIDGRVVFTTQDPMDILVSRYTDPFNLHSTRYLIHPHIFVPLTTLELNPLYDQDKVKMLKSWHGSKQGLQKASDNAQMLMERQQKMSDMGVSDAFDPIIGETYVELTLHFVMRREPGAHYERFYVYTEADEYVTLMKKPLEDVIGKTSDNYWSYHVPYSTWADDVERQDFWSDGIGDIVRTSNEVANVWFSQLVEHRTLRSFGMHYYDSTEEGFQPQTYQPQAFGWYGVPGNPNELIQKVDIPDLSESLDEMEWLIGMNERATGATATQQGAPTEKKITLGEVELAFSQAQERIKGMSKFYTPAWKERGEMFSKMIEAAPDKLNAVKIFRKGRSTNNIYGMEIEPKHYLTKSGYQCKVWSQDEKNQQDMQSLQKIDAVSANMPDNPKLMEIKQRKMLEFAGLSPDEINEVMAFEDAKRQAMVSMIGQGVEVPGLPAGDGGGAGPKLKPAPGPLQQLPATVE